MKRLVLLFAVAILAGGCGNQDANSMPTKASAKMDHLQEGVEFLKASNPVEAIHSFDEAIKQDPLNPTGYVVLGQTYMRMGQYDRAIDSFSAATRVAPQQGEIYYLLAVSHGLAGNRQDAIENAQVSIGLFQNAKDEENLIKAVALLRGLTEGQEVPQGDMSQMQAGQSL